jgi:hypothetical protein
VSRYFFHVVETRTKKRVRDFEGATFRNVSEAQKEAICLAHDIGRHRLYGQTWHVVVTDENSHRILIIPVARVRLRKLRTWFDLAVRAAAFEPSLPPRLFTCLLLVLVLAMGLQAAILSQPVTHQTGRYTLASDTTKQAVVFVRFTPQSSIAEVSSFLRTYNALLLLSGLPQGGLYRLHTADATLQRDDLEKLVRRMAREKIVEFATAAH